MTPVFTISSEASHALAAFLAANLPLLDEWEGWGHMFSTAYQIGCAALVALGHATETPWGAIPRHPPQPPATPPRADDLCIAALWLANQQGLSTYSRPDGTLPERRGNTFIVRPATPQPMPAPDILPAYGLGAARAQPQVLSLLDTLGLLDGGRWTPVAEALFWRVQPAAWGMDVPNDPHFAAAANSAVATLPAWLRTQIDQLTIITEADLAASLAAHQQGEAALDARSGPNRRRTPPPSAKGIARGLSFHRTCNLNNLFFANWRLPDGWLSPAGAKTALFIFHDPLAIQMRRAVLARLHPDRPAFAA